MPDPQRMVGLSLGFAKCRVWITARRVDRRASPGHTRVSPYHPKARCSEFNGAGGYNKPVLKNNRQKYPIQGADRAPAVITIG
jgi:hypothetical protein